MKEPLVLRVISGGQTGADQGGLRAARKLGIPTGGVAPKGFATEEGPSPSLGTEYGLTESDVAFYPVRTATNVRDCDVCLWFGEPSSRGGRLTQRLCLENGKPMVVIDPDRMEPEVAAGFVRDLAAERRSASATLMVAGNRESVNPGIAGRTEAFLTAMLPFLV